MRSDTAVTTWLCPGGTRLATPQGDRAVDTLAPGDTLLADDGTMLPVRWVGRLHLPAATLATQPGLRPLRLSAEALGMRQPPRATPILPAQTLVLDGFPPVAARWLVDGHAVSRPAPAPLDIFSLVLGGTAPPAGAPCLAEDEAEPPRPDDATLHALRRRLAGRDGTALHGSLDTLTRQGIAGWVAEPEAPGPVAIELVVNGIAQSPVLADTYRPDLEAAGIGDGRHGFHLPLQPALDPRRRHLIRLRRALDGADLPGSPILLDAAAGLSPLLEHLHDPDTLREAARTLAGLLEA